MKKLILGIIIIAVLVIGIGSYVFIKHDSSTSASTNTTTPISTNNSAETSNSAKTNTNISNSTPNQIKNNTQSNSTNDIYPANQDVKPLSPTSGTTPINTFISVVSPKQAADVVVQQCGTVDNGLLKDSGFINKVDESMDYFLAKPIIESITNGNYQKDMDLLIKVEKFDSSPSNTNSVAYYNLQSLDSHLTGYYAVLTVANKNEVASTNNGNNNNNNIVGTQYVLANAQQAFPEILKSCGEIDNSLLSDSTFKINLQQSLNSFMSTKNIESINNGKPSNGANIDLVVIRSTSQPSANGASYYPLQSLSPSLQNYYIEMRMVETTSPFVLS